MSGLGRLVGYLAVVLFVGSVATLLIVPSQGRAVSGPPLRDALATTAAIGYGGMVLRVGWLAVFGDGLRVRWLAFFGALLLILGFVGFSSIPLLTNGVPATATG